MRVTTRNWLALAALAAAPSTVNAQIGVGGGMGGAGGGGGVAYQGMGPVLAQGYAPAAEKAPRHVPKEAAEAWLRLREPISLSFGEETALADVIKKIEEEVGKRKENLSIYLNYAPGNEGDSPLAALVVVDLKDVPLASALTLILRPHGLNYYVQEDGIVVIDNFRPIAHPDAVPPLTAAAAKTWLKLNLDMSFPFQNDTTLDAAFKYVRNATQGPDMPGGLPIYVNEVSLRDNDMSLDTTIRFDMEKVPLSSGLELFLEQVGLTYRVRRDGLVIVEAKADPEGASASKGPGLDDLKDQVARAKLQAELADYRAKIAQSENTLRSLARPAMGGIGGGMGGMGGGMMGGMGGGMGGGMAGPGMMSVPPE